MPARGGSKGIPRKNIRLLGGHPLLAYTLAAARSAGLGRVLLSTEDEEIAAVGKGLGFDVPFMRPEELATDETPTVPVLLHVLDALSKARELGDIDYVCVLQPTSPFRTAETIQRCLQRLEPGPGDGLGPDSVVTVLPVPTEYNPHWVYLVSDAGEMQLFMGDAEPITRRQDLPPVYHRDGSVYLVKREVLEQEQSLYGKQTAAVEVEGGLAVNLDVLEDWRRAELLLAAHPELASGPGSSETLVCGLCGISGPQANAEASRRRVAAMSLALEHRGPDDSGDVALQGFCASFRRLSIIDLSPTGHQPMRRGPLTMLFNGEVYNHLELRSDLEAHGATFVGSSDSEVLLVAFEQWGSACLDRLLGMFAIAIWDERDRSLFLARDRFGVKPLYLAPIDDGELPTSIAFASEIGALQAAGLGREPDQETWARYLTDGAAERGRRTFWRGIERLGAGEMATFKDGVLKRSVWYDLEHLLESQLEPGDAFDDRSDADVSAEFVDLLEDAVRLRFRADVPVGINLSGGLDSSLLLALVGRTQGAALNDINAFTFITGDDRYDELPWVEGMLKHAPHAHSHPHHPVRLSPQDVPRLAPSVAASQGEPAGGLPTLAYAKLFESARELGVKVLLDGQGVDETWAGYDYYQRLLNADSTATNGAMLQGSVSPSTRPEAMTAELRTLASTSRVAVGDGAGLKERSALVARQLFDIQHGKLPRALRYNDRVSMRSSVELREPFLDHRLVELGLRQPPERKIKEGVGKALPREVAQSLLPSEVRLAPKRALQTPQREWLRGELSEWARAQIEAALETGFLDRQAAESEWERFARGEGDNAFFVWQWIDLGLLVNPPSV